MFAKARVEIKELKQNFIPKKIFFSEGRRQRLLKRIKTDNVDCDGHLGEDFRLKI